LINSGNKLVVNPLIRTKLYIPTSRQRLVSRPRLIEKINQGVAQKLILISAPAGFGKTTLVNEWLTKSGKRAAWLSLDERDGDLNRFLEYFIAALQPVSEGYGRTSLCLVQSPKPPSIESILTTLINEIAAIPDELIIVLDDYHLLDSQPVDHALTFLLEHLPPQAHILITTREDPNLPLTQMRAKGQLTEVRAAHLRFTPAETSEFLTAAMGLNLSAESIEALEARTEGWIAGLQLAAISIKGHIDIAGFIASFTGSNRFVLDYLAEEVLTQQPDYIQEFLLHTSILDQLSGPLCDAILPNTNIPGQQMLQKIEQANLFLIPLDDHRQWYRYHHLFAGLLQQRLLERAASATNAGGIDIAALHIRASEWYEENNLEIDAFQHAVLSKDIARAERLMEGGGMPLQYRGALRPVLNWLASLPAEVMNIRPSLWVAYASVATMAGKPVDDIREILQSAEAALDGAPRNDKNRDLLGQIAAIRAMLAVSQNECEVITAQAQRALENLHPDNLSMRTSATWALGFAHQCQGDRAEAARTLSQALSISQSSGNIVFTIASATSLGQIYESDLRLNEAGEAYQQVLLSAGEPPLSIACEAFLGLARIAFERNDLDAACQHTQQSLQLAGQIENVNTPLFCELLLSRIDLARMDIHGAAEKIARAELFVRHNNFLHHLPEVAAARIDLLLRQGNPEKALPLAKEFDLPLGLGNVYLAQNEASKALEIVQRHRRQAAARGWKDELFKADLLEALARHSLGKEEEALAQLHKALALAEYAGLIRSFIDQGPEMARLLTRAAYQKNTTPYLAKLLAAFEQETQRTANGTPLPETQPLVDPLTKRELEVLRMVADGLSNQEISERLFLALNTIKGYNHKIFSKLQVQRRTEAVARARELGIL